MRAKHALVCAAAFLGLAALPGLACGEKKGGIMLAVTTDMLAPKDVNVVSVSIQVGPEIKYNFIGRVTPEGEVLLPATLAIVEPEDPAVPIRVRVIAFKETKPRVLRDVTTTSPRNGRVALLRMPLSFVNDDSVTGELPIGNVPPRSGSAGLGTLGSASLGSTSLGLSGGLRPLADPFNPWGAEVVSRCTDPDQTMIDGECVSAIVDSESLPEYSDALVFPDGDRSQCFATSSCFQGWRQVEVDLANCTVPKDGDVWNVTLVTSHTGACSPSGRCFIPIDKADDGWREEGDRVRLPKGICKKVREGAFVGVVGKNACAQKTPGVPVCTNGPSAPIVADAGAEGGDAGRPTPEKMGPASGIYGLAVLPGGIYVGTADGLFQLFESTLNNIGVTDTRIGPWYVAQTADNAVFVDGTPSIGTGDVKAHIFPNNGDAKPVLLPAPAATPRGAAIGPTKAWFPFTGAGGGVVGSDTQLAGEAIALSGLAFTATGFADAVLWVGHEDGKVATCTPGSPYTCSGPVTLDAKLSPVDGLAALPADLNGAHAFALRRDGVFLVTSNNATAPPQSRRLTNEELPPVVDTVDFPRGIAATPKCAFYASPNGLQYIGTEPGAPTILAEHGNAPVVNVVVPPFPEQGGPYVYYAVRDAIPSGGGVYRVKLPAACQ